MIQPRNDYPAPLHCARDQSISETEEAPQALGFRGLQRSIPTCRVPLFPSRENGSYEVCGDEFQDKTGSYEVYSDGTNSIYLYSPNSTQSLRMRVIWGLEMITIVQLKHRCEDIFYFPTDLSGAPKSREPLNLLHSSRLSAHHALNAIPLVLKSPSAISESTTLLAFLRRGLTTRPSSSAVYTVCAIGNIQVIAALTLKPAESR